MISAGRVLLMPKGDYNPATTYELLDLVSYQNSSYIAKGTTTGNLPTDATYWQLSAFGGSVANLTGNFAEIESSTIAQAPHAIGDVFVDLDSNLVEATAQINVTDTIAVGTNCEYTTVEALLNKLAAKTLKLIADNAITVQTDLDTVTTLGDYYKAATTFYVTNAPTGIDSNPLSTFRLTVLKGAGSSDILQSIVSSDGKTYKRGYDGSTWGTWIEFSSAATVSGINTRLTTAETDIDNLEASRLKTYTADSTAWDTAPTSASTKPVTSDGIKTEIDKKLPTYANGSGSWDTTPTASSTKPVTSGGVKTQIDTINGNKANQAVIATRQANLTASRRYEIGDQFIYNNTLYKATAVIANGAAINIGSSGNATTADNVTTQIGKFDQKVLGHAVGATAIPISNYHDVDVACIYTLNGTSFTWLFHIPNYFISQLGNNYRFLRQGDSQSIIILGVTSNLVTLNTAMFDGANVASNIDLYVYST